VLEPARITDLAVPSATATTATLAWTAPGNDGMVGLAFQGSRPPIPRGRAKHSWSRGCRGGCSTTLRSRRPMKFRTGPISPMSRARCRTPHHCGDSQRTRTQRGATAPGRRPGRGTGAGSPFAPIGETAGETTRT
jgi:hypothetical protein